MQLFSIVLADGQAVPVNKTFEPYRAQNGDSSPAELWEKSSPTINGFRRLTCLVKRNSSTKSTKVTILIVDPQLAVTAPSTATGIQPSPTVAFNCLAKMEFTLPDACSLQNRKDILAYAKNLLGHAVATDMVVNLSPQY